MKNKASRLSGVCDVVVVTGGSSGIGMALIRQLHRLRSSLEFCNLSRAEPELNLPGLRLTHYPCDLKDRGGLDGALDKLSGELPPGKLLLINNAGFGAYGAFPEPSACRQLEMLDVNVRAPLALTGRLLPLLRERGGAILNVASTAAFQPTPYMSVYGAGKAFLLHWSLALERELAGAGVRVLAVCPGPTSTDFFRRAGYEKSIVPHRLGQTPERVAEIAIEALLKNRALCVCGWKNRLLAATASSMPKVACTRLTATVLRRFRLDRLEPKGGGTRDS